MRRDFNEALALGHRANGRMGTTGGCLMVGWRHVTAGKMSAVAEACFLDDSK